ncbi:septum formation family protein [Nocardioides humilatus]|uniref:septum formation family protein n=1 Tax=Nocardioides humilatus TaxID=2607660 RepID=UPI00165FA68D|nr:septum formation family protein [Nocardioides humilatus]
MKLRLGAAVLSAALISTTAFTTAAPATAGPGTDVTPPEVGTCHDLTWEEYYAKFEPEAAIDCATRHTSLTVRVTQYESVPDDWGQVITDDYTPCLKDAVTATGGDAAQYQMTSYSITFYRPTRAQQQAGAAWLRCDVVLRGGHETLAPIPQDVVLTGLRPPANVRKCRLGSAADYELTVCTRRHKYVAYTTAHMRDDRYPGERAAKRFAGRKCNDLIGGAPFVYEWVPNKFYWRAGLRNAVCLPLDD